jgi:hypothetical protein
MELIKDKDGNEIFCIDAENRQKLTNMAFPPSTKSKKATSAPFMEIKSTPSLNVKDCVRFVAQLESILDQISMEGIDHV